MAIFYLLPPRPLVADALAEALQSWLPGVVLDDTTGLSDALGDAVADRPDVFLVFREDLPEGVHPDQALADGFGAEPGDEVVEVRAAGADRPPAWTRRRLGAAVTVGEFCYTVKNGLVPRVTQPLQPDT